MTHHITAMLDVHSQAAEIAEKSKLAECIAACFQCAQTPPAPDKCLSAAPSDTGAPVPV